ncbi:MAG: hypothetical protein KJ648_07160 [Candidatus Omnitrophica bacterium]|nr:hypothetical protein [Candidatus Omnitrophota bacterium]
MSSIGYQHRRAKKEHRCSWCDEKILVGERYARWLWKDGGDLGPVLMHFECEEGMTHLQRLERESEIEFQPGTFKRGTSEER